MVHGDGSSRRRAEEEGVQSAQEAAFNGTASTSQRIRYPLKNKSVSLQGVHVHVDSTAVAVTCWASHHYVVLCMCLIIKTKMYMYV